MVNIICISSYVCSWGRHNAFVHRTLILIYILIFAIIFLCVLPYFCHAMVFSWYFQAKQYGKIAEDILNNKNEIRLRKADKYLDYLNAIDSKKWHEMQLKSELDVVVIVKTVDRTAKNSNPYTGYLTQTITTLDREIRRMGSGDLRVGQVVCNVDRYPHLYKEAQRLDKYFLSVVKYANGSSSYSKQDQREIEKNDYIFCLQISTSMRAKYVLMIEDDTEPYESLFVYLKEVIRNRLERRLIRGDYETDSAMSDLAFVKLYYPERWAGYGLEIAHIFELAGIGALTGSLCLIFDFIFGHNKRMYTVLWYHMVMGFCLGILVALCVGRQYLLELRRFSTLFLLLTKAPGCCTPAVLFTSNRVNSIVKFLENVECKEEYGVDLAIDDYALTTSSQRYLVQPNLFHHRGVYSTLTKPKNRVEFLFDN